MVDAALETHFEVAQVLRRQRGKVDVGARQVDPFMLLEASADEDLAVHPAGADFYNGQNDGAVIETNLHALLDGLGKLLEAGRELLGRAGNVGDADARARALSQIDGLAVAQAAHAQARALQVHDDRAGLATLAGEGTDQVDVLLELLKRGVGAVEAERVDACGEQVQHERGLVGHWAERGENLSELRAGRRRLMFVGGH